MTTEPPKIADLAIPADGPWDPEQLATAASAIAELARRLEHATRAGTTPRHPSDLHRVVAALFDAVARLEMAVNGIAGKAYDLVGEHDGERIAADTVYAAAHELQVATAAMREAAIHLDRAQRETGRIGHAVTPEPTIGPHQRTSTSARSASLPFLTQASETASTWPAREGAPVRIPDPAADDKPSRGR